MNQRLHSARSIVAIALTAAGMAGCNDYLETTVEGQITSGSVNSPAAADALRICVLGSFHGLTSGQSNGTLGGSLVSRGLWNYSGILADEWKASSSNAEIPELDRRQASSGNAAVAASYNIIHQTRARAREAIGALNTYLPTPLYVGQMYITMALAEVMLGELFCNGTPLSGQENGQVVYGMPLTNAAVFAAAGAHLDTALTYLGATDAATVSWNRAARVLKARALIDIGGAANFTAAVALLSAIPTTYTFQNTFSATVAENGIFVMNVGATNNTHQQVGDSLNPTPALGIVRNVVPFASARDPRVPVTGSSVTPSPLGNGNDSQTPRVAEQIWTANIAAVNIVSGLDARLIEAEADLQANNFAAMTTKLNTLRAAPPALSPTLTPAVMPALATPATRDAAIDQFFREKAFWTFGRGQRLGDMRRMIRQYGRAANTVFPEGLNHNTGAPYGSAVNFPIPTSEATNPNITKTTDFCIDRTA